MIGHDTNTLDAINLTTDIEHLSDTVIATVKEIQARIKYFSIATDCEIAILFAPLLKDCFVNPLQGIPFVQDDNVPDDTVYVLCKSAGSWPVIRPADNIDWAEFYLKILKGEDPELALAIDAMFLQARIKVVNNGRQQSIT